MKDELINRDASPSARGYRLQKLRAAKSILDLVADDSECSFWCNIEKEADVSLSYSNPDGSLDKKLEEDKNYLAGQKMTLNSKAILNTLVMFIDKYHELSFNQKVLFHFYTTASIGSEGATSFSRQNEINFPEEPILSKLNISIDGVEQRHKEVDSKVLDIISQVVINEYQKQYSKKESKGCLDSIKSWSNDNWNAFLSQVTFSFNQLDDQELEKELFELCKINKFYTQSHLEKEEVLVAMLLDEIEKTQVSGFNSQSYITLEKLQVIYYKVKANEYKPIDPSWSSWSQIDKPSDVRNIEEKVRAVVNKAGDSFLSRLNRRAANGLSIVKGKENDKSIKALLYIIYDSCEEELDTISKLKSGSYTEIELKEHIQTLLNVAVMRVEEKSKDYVYSVSNQDDFRDLILHLVDSCFLAFEVN